MLAKCGEGFAFRKSKFPATEISVVDSLKMKRPAATIASSAALARGAGGTPTLPRTTASVRTESGEVYTRPPLR